MSGETGDVARPNVSVLLVNPRKLNAACLNHRVLTDNLMCS